MIHPVIARKILTEFSHLSGGRAVDNARTKAVPHNLSGREVTVLRHVAEGKTNKEIANTLNLSEKTVKNHIRNIFSKLNVFDRTQAAIYALKNGLIDVKVKE